MKKTLFLSMLLAMFIGLVACDKKKEEEKGGEQDSEENAEKKDEGKPCPDASKLTVKVKQWDLDQEFEIKSGTVVSNNDGICKFRLQTYEGNYKAQGALEEGEYNIEFSIYTDYNIKPRPAVKSGMKFGMPSDNYKKNNASYSIKGKDNQTTTWWSAFGDGNANSVEVDLLQISDSKLCANITSSIIDQKEGEIAGSVLNGSISITF